MNKNLLNKSQYKTTSKNSTLNKNLYIVVCLSASLHLWLD